MQELSVQEVEVVSGAGWDQVAAGAAAGAVYGTFAAGPVGFAIGVVGGGFGGAIGWLITELT